MAQLRIAIVFALPAEFSPWRRRQVFRSAHASGPAIYQAQIGRAAVRVGFSGIGALNVHRDPHAWFAHPADCVIVAGAAGGLKRQYRCGDVLVASHVKSALSERVLAADHRLVSLASRCGATIVDSFLTVDRMVGRAEHKTALGRDADAVDMESFVVVDAVASRGIPAVAVRVIADTADEDLPLDLSRAIRADGTISIPRVIGAALARPPRWPRLVRTGWSYHRALGELALFLDRFVEELTADLKVRTTPVV